jgi:hypothetical protein
LGSEESSEESSIEGKQQRRAYGGEERRERNNLSGEESVSGPRLVSCQQETGCQNSDMTSADWMETKCHHQKRKLKEKCQGEKKRRDKQQATGRFVKIQR